MRRIVSIMLLGWVLLSMCGCEHLYDSVRQTGKNINATFLEGYQKDLYKSR